MERRLYGLTTIEIRHLAYEIAEKLNMNHCFSKSTNMAGVDSLQGFLSRHPNLSIRVPTATNLSRAVAFNSVTVTQFFDEYKEILQDGTYDNASIWNMDESGISNVQKPGKIIATRGSRTVGKMIFKALKAAYNAQADCWMVNHPGMRISMYDISGIF